MPSSRKVRRSIHRGSAEKRLLSADGSGVIFAQRKSAAASSQTSSPLVSAIKMVSGLL
jgi:hypothetical protein